MDESIVEVSQKTIYIGGKPVFLLSAEMHYYEISADLWQENISKLKNGGYNAISIFIPWAFHETEEGKIDFNSPKKNIAQLFDICKANEMYILIRPGPRNTHHGKFEYLPKWLFTNYPEIIDLDVNGTQAVFGENKKPIVAPLHPKYMEKVKTWYEIINRFVQKYQFPQGNIILYQIDDEFTFNVESQYFSFGFHPIYNEFYQNFLKKKYLLVQALNEIYGEHYLTFEEINPPYPPKQNYTHEYSFELLPFLDWLEFKEWVISEFISILVEFVRDNEIFIPIYLNINSYKSPINTQHQLTHNNVLYEGSNVVIGFNFLPEVFHSQVNVNCFTSWHIEWLKSHFHNPPFIAKFQEYSEKRPYKQLNTHTLFQLSLAHGIRAISSNIKNDSTLNGPIQIARSLEVKKLHNFIKTNENVIRSLVKSYDALSVAYYHPYTRLKSKGDIFNSLNFGFSMDYEQLKINYKNYLQLLTKYFIHYDVIDLHQITGVEMAEKPYIMLYYLGWMEHETMVLLQEYVENGGKIISFGDIPMYNEYFEEDRTLYSLYFAKAKEELNITDVIWIGREHSETILHINKLYSYNLEFIQNAQILAHSDDGKRIHAFSRHYKMGKVIHSGIMVSSHIDSVDMLSKLFEDINFPTKNVSASGECVVIQNLAPNEERLITVGNLNPNPQNNISFNLYNPKGKKFAKNLEIDNISIPPNIFSTWHAFMRLSPNLVIQYCTAEVHEYVKTEGTQKLRLLFPILKNSLEPHFLGKISLMYLKGEMKIEPIKGDVRSTFSAANDEKFNYCMIEFSDSVAFMIHYLQITYTFEIEKETIEGI
ncbi:hypothetical protein NEF87_003474 [Candidatus Lokiarchaeum ossiferum]|uniref:Glycoside hydrolase 35 catalytic domain-containing protein n=1 Tax=Candidatus Lokiarchaeum ossiferum TaxID=2951803 RepID=A0ABY6HXK7_9ARCH|nr:hypothetical protein NEF87_003474 [Candidatus Lokiarchaeum sp. B-35]